MIAVPVGAAIPRRTREPPMAVTVISIPWAGITIDWSSLRPRISTGSASLPHRPSVRVAASPTPPSATGSAGSGPGSFPLATRLASLTQPPHAGQRIRIADSVAVLVGDRLKFADRLNQRDVDRRHVAGSQPGVDVEVVVVRRQHPVAETALGQPHCENLRSDSGPLDERVPHCQPRSRAVTTGGRQWPSSR